jgi:hypothetical protein
MSDTEVAAAVSVDTIVAKVAQLRAQIPPLRRIISNANADLSHWLDEMDTSAAVDEIARTEKQIEDINTQTLELARLVTEPHPLWPGGWLIEKIGQDDPARRWRSPWVPWDTPSFTPGARRTAWRTQAAAEAAVPAEHPGRYRVVWSPIGRTDFSEYLNTTLDAASLDAIGNPRVRVHDVFAGYHPWSNTGDSEVVHVIAVPSPEVAELVGQYAPVFDDQPALAAVPQPWLHLNLWMDPAGCFKPGIPDLDEKLAERILADRPDIAGDAVHRALADRRTPTEEPWGASDSWWRYYCEMEELLRGAPLPAKPAADDWEGQRNAGPDVPTDGNWDALPLIDAFRKQLFAEARESVLDSFAAHLADQPSVDVTVGPAVADDDGVQLDVWPETPLQALLDRCDSWPRVSGYRDRRRPGWRPMLPIAYGISDAQVDLTGLYNVRQRVTWTITEVAVVAMRRDPERGRYMWEELRRIPLRRS